MPSAIHAEPCLHLLSQVEKWVAEECIPADNVYSSQLAAQASRWSGHPSILETLKDRARELGIWNMFLPKNHFANEGSPGFTNLEYGLMAEQLGKSRIASEACNCAAPDTGNMEVIARYGNRVQKDKWLKPLLAGQIRYLLSLALSSPSANFPEPDLQFPSDPASS